ncbi:MAG: hypothetical protein CMJ18_17780 [Phycisphaeraceae bacterium]|nr:hypothetical protein [Phycisphaeraceae bacterium]
MTPKVLIVDDLEDNRCVLVDALEDEQLILEKACDGEEALRKVRDSAPDLVLLDVVMPGMDGIEVCRLIKASEATARVPIILVTALGEDRHVIDGLNAGATDYVAKPFAGQVVRARVRAALRSKLAQDTLQQRNDEIAQLNEVIEQKNRKLTVLTETAHRFVDNVAHEFRTPLSVIKEFASIIEEGLSGPVTEQQREHLKFIEGAARELAQMVDDFLDSSKLKARTLRVDRRNHAVASLIEGVLPMLESRAASRRIGINVQVSSDMPPVFADRDKVARVILNLVVNAIKFSPEQSTVTIRASTRSADDVEIQVIDSGPGMPPEETSRIFERFRQVGEVSRDGVKGFGLGLNIARELVWLNLGTLGVRSDVGSGSVFYFTLPALNPDHIVRAYVDRLAEHEEPPVRLALLAVRDARRGDLESVRRFLVATCYPMDLALSTGDAIIVAGVTTEPQRWAQRLRDRKKKKEDTPPDLDLVVDELGCWPFAQRSKFEETLLSRFQQERAVA